MGFVTHSKRHQTKPTLSELNRAHKDEYIHYEAIAEGMELFEATEPQYQGVKSGPKTSHTLNNHNQLPTGEKDTAEREFPTIVGDADLRERATALCNKYPRMFSTKLNP